MTASRSTSCCCKPKLWTFIHVLLRSVSLVPQVDHSERCHRYSGFRYEALGFAPPGQGLAMVENMRWRENSEGGK